MSQEITVKYTIQDSEIEDIACCAFEGGINYWVGAVHVVPEKYKTVDKYKSELAPICALRLELLYSEDEDPKSPVIITPEKWAQGIKMAAEFKGRSIQDFIEECDAIDADLAVQFAVFGELVYG